jgi:hypothetical protein
MATNAPPEPTMQTARYVQVNLLNLAWFLDVHHLRITHVNIVGTREGQLWIEAETRSTLDTGGEVITTDQDAGSGPHHQERRGPTS